MEMLQGRGMSKILRLIDGPIALLPCVSLNFYEKCKNCDEKNCTQKINIFCVAMKTFNTNTSSK